MATLADLFKTCYLTGGSGVEFSAVRLHHRGVDEICLCFNELFSLRRTSATRILASAVSRRFGVPSPDVEALRNG